MLYQPPTGSTDPNAPYVGKNVSAGIQGSKVPPGAVEFPQREITTVETAAGLSLANDNTQLLRAIRGGQLFTFTDTSGAANALVITPGVAHTAVVKGLPFRIFPANTNTSATVTLQVNTLTAALRRHDGTALVAGDIVAGVPFDCVSDGSNFRLLGFAASDIAAIIASANPAAGYVTLGDQSYTVASSDKVLATSVAFTTPRTWTLPAAGSHSAGDTLVYLDCVGAVSAVNTLTFAKTGSDTIDGLASYVIGSPYRIITFRSDGSSKWTYNKEPSTAFRSAGDANVTILASDGTVATSAALTAPRTWTLPAASTVRAGASIVLADLFGACGATNSITLARTGSDTINGATSLALTSAYFQVFAVSDGVSRWSIQYIDIIQLQSLLSSATSGLEKGWRIVTTNSAASPITALDHQRIQVDVSAGNATVNLPNTPTANTQFDIYRYGTSSNTLTVTTAGGSTVFAFNDGTTDTGISMGSDTSLNIIGIYADGSVYRCNPGIVV